MPVKRINIPVDPPEPKKLVKITKQEALPKEKLPKVSKTKNTKNDY